MGWADEQRKLLVRTNADQPDQAANAIAFGAQGIGCAAPSTCSSAATASSPCAR